MYKQIYLILMIILSINIVYALNENSVWITVEIINDNEKLIEVGDGPHYKVNITNIGDSFINNTLNISLIYPSRKEKFLEELNLTLDPYSRKQIIQKSPKEGEHGILIIDEEGTYNLKITSLKELQMYRCDKIKNITPENISKDFCASSYQRLPKEIIFPFEVLSLETKNIFQQLRGYIDETRKEAEESIIIAKESKRIAHWSFLLVLLALLISFFNEKNLIFQSFKNSFFYKDLNKLFKSKFIKSILNPLIKRKRVLFYSSLFLFIYIFFMFKYRTGILFELISVLTFFTWFAILIRYTRGLIILFLIVGWKILYNYIGYNDTLMIIYVPLITQLILILMFYLKDIYKILIKLIKKKSNPFN